MKLTKAMREKFVDDVMNGIPVKHHFDRESIRNQIKNLYESQLPVDIIEFSKKYPHLIKREKHLSINQIKYLTRDGYERNLSIWIIDSDSYVNPNLTEILELKNKFQIEQNERDALRERLLEIANSCTTLAKLKVALPELESYMPNEEVKRNLPVASGTVITDLLQLGLKIPK